MVPESFTETYVPLVLNKQYNVGLNFTTSELMLNIDEFDDRVLKPAVATLANKIDFDGLALATQVANFVGIPGVTPASAFTYLAAKTALDNNAAPIDNERSVTINSIAEAYIVDALKGLFHSGDQLEEQYMKGKMGTALSWDWYMDQNVVNHAWAYGTSAVTVAMNQTSAGLATGWAASSTLTISNTGSCQLNPGDVIQIAGVYGVNPQNRQSYGKLRNFVVTTAMAAGGTSVTVSPAIIYGGQFQNVSNTPTSTAAITVLGVAASAATQNTTAQNILCHKNAFTLATADLVVPSGVDFAGRASDKSSGLSIRVVKQYTINNDSIPTRLDVLYGWAPLYPELACRVTS